MFQVTFKVEGKSQLQIAFFEREQSAYDFKRIATFSGIVTYLSDIEFVILSGM